jgi:DNA processing protein
MATIADLVVVIEATKTSGTMLTAFAAKELNTKLAAIPGNIDAPLSEGPNMLLASGAHFITSSDDICALLHIERKVSQSLFESEAETLHPLLAHLGAPLHKDALLARACLSAAELNTEIMMLELGGLVRVDESGVVHRLHKHLL